VADSVSLAGAVQSNSMVEALETSYLCYVHIDDAVHKLAAVRHAGSMAASDGPANNGPRIASHRTASG
jgi:hypothetical protein